MSGPEILRGRTTPTLSRQLFLCAVIGGLSLMSVDGLRRVFANRKQDAAISDLKMSEVDWNVHGTSVRITLRGRKYDVSPELPAGLKITKSTVGEDGITIFCEAPDLTGNTVTGTIFISKAEIHEALDPLVSATRKEHSSMLDYKVAVDPCGDCARDFLAQTTVRLAPNPMEITLKRLPLVPPNDLAQVQNR